ncbi:MAG: ammonia-forming cytochrome c nitrite reductase [Candidatus Omnitrophota bacterium]|nr:ammonia-forming cytochrome c nitrite reductase [Candidatus Omnitrophota bacterium]MDZ4242237.1 ammonia-forming cytochrome c nitrite reductase [Candidatus Omnitrophota bacterium]
MKTIVDLIRKRPIVGWGIFLATAMVVYVFGLFATSIIERRAESRMARQVLHPIDELEVRSEEWAKNYPRQYDRYKMTAQGEFASREGGSVMIDMLERDPRMVVLWAGYAFSRDYSQGRGHAHTIEDIRNTLRTGAPQPATCWSCKSPDVVRMMAKTGPAEFYKGKWIEKGHEVTHAIGCLDCHDPKTMSLRISRPALLEALERQGKKTADLTHQEMRTMVCAQCHVEYYFKGDGKYLTFPWDKGMEAENIEDYYDAAGFSDWTHALSKTPMLKAQHPDYEIWTKGIHAQRGVSCVDCHMPYRREGGVKFTDHWIQSPLNNISNSCQVCHREDEETLRQNVFERQDKVRELRIMAEDALVKAHVEAKAAWDAGATEAEMKPILQLIRHAQWRWDYAAASHGAAFHAPLEVSRILGTSIEKSQEARLQLARVLLQRGVKDPVPVPDISTKAKAQAYIGLDMNTFIAEKRQFLETVIPQWDKGVQPKPEQGK